MRDRRAAAEGQELAPAPALVVEAVPGDPALVSAEGELDLATFDLLRGPVCELLENGARHVVIDVSGVTFADSSGLGTIVELRRLAEQVAARVVLRAPTASLRRLLTITGLDDAVEIESERAPA